MTGSPLPSSPSSLPPPSPMLPAWLGEVPGDVVFATVSGAHLYGFPSADSDVDLRGVHLLPIEDIIGLRDGAETIDRTWTRDGVEVDLVTHDLAKFCRLLFAAPRTVLRCPSAWTDSTCAPPRRSVGRPDPVSSPP